jgi:type II secretion system protein C
VKGALSPFQSAEMTSWIDIEPVPKPIAWLLGLVAAAVAAFAIYSVTMDVRGTLQAQRAPAASAPQPASGNKAKPRVDVQSIVSAHLFGASPSEAPAPEPEKAPETQLSLQLAGVLASNDAKLSRAIISADSGSAKSYAIGDTIEGTDARLQNVEPGRVLIERNGQLESLPLVRTGLEEESAGPGGVQDTLPPLGTQTPAESLRTPRGSTVNGPTKAGAIPPQGAPTGSEPGDDAAAMIPRVPF